MNIIKSDNFNQLFIEGISFIKEYGEWTKPRGFKCKELINQSLVLTNPEKNLCTIKERKLNYAYIIIERMMFLSGISNPEVLISYNKQMKSYLNNKNDFDGAYGPRINGQLYFIFRELLKDRESRRAVITIHDKTDNNLITKDSSCTLTWQFLIRKNKLIMVTNMRSNDIKWGTCIDIPVFTFFQEVISFWLNIKPGYYYHNTASLHYYEEFEKELLSYYKINEMYQPELTGTLIKKEFPKWNINYKDTKKALSLFWKEEKNIRNKRKYNKTGFKTIDDYLDILLKYWQKKDIKTA